MAQLTRTQLQTEIDSQIVSNNNRTITADIVNNIFTNVNDSTINTLTDASTFGLFEYDITKTYQIGQCVVYGNQLYKAIVLVTGGSFDRTKFTLQSPKMFKAKLTGVNAANPTIQIIRDDLFFGSQPFLTYTSAGLVRFEYNQSVFAGTFSVSFDNTQRRDSQNPAFAFTNIINSTTNDVYFTTIGGAATDDVTTIYTLTTY